jgi:hypothetical protein
MQTLTQESFFGIKRKFKINYIYCLINTNIKNAGDIY